MGDGREVAAAAAGRAQELSEEARVRQRYVDLIVRPQARDMVRTRAGVVRACGSCFHSKGFIEIETPMLQTLHGGAAARPFVTHMNALDIDLYLRIAPELFLKRAVVGGLHKVFEINRNFRNEGMDASHSPEFAMLEFYEAYGDYDSVADLTRELVQAAARRGARHTGAAGRRHRLRPRRRVDQPVHVRRRCPRRSARRSRRQRPAELLRSTPTGHGLEVDPKLGHGKLVELLWEHLVGDHLWAPTFVRDFPVETTPLTREHRSIPGVTENGTSMSGASSWPRATPS